MDFFFNIHNDFLLLTAFRKCILCLWTDGICLLGIVIDRNASIMRSIITQIRIDGRGDFYIVERLAVLREISRFIRPDKIAVSGFQAIDENILACTEAVFYSHKINPFCSFIHSHPPLQRSQIHDLIPEFFVLHHRTVQLCHDAAEIQAVAGGLVRRDPHCHIFGIGQNATLGGCIFREFGAGMSAW